MPTTTPVTSTMTTSSETGTVPSTGQQLTINLTAPIPATAPTITVSGIASRSEVQATNYNIAYVFDVSGSMTVPFSGAQSIGDANNDGLSGTLLDAAVASYQALTDSLLAANLGSSARVALIPFESSATIAYQGLVGTDADSNQVSDVTDALQALRAGATTNYEAGLQQAASFFSSAGQGNNFVFFMSDGAPDSMTAFRDEVSSLISPTGSNATIRAIGLGNGASLTALDLVDDNTANNSAQRVTTPSALTTGLTRSPVAQAEIASVDLYLDGRRVQSIASSALTSTPLGLQYQADISGLDATNTIEARLVANDSASTTITTSLSVPLASTAPTTPVRDDYTANIRTRGRITIGADIDANLERQGDVDWFQVRLRRGVEYVIGAENDDGSQSGDLMVQVRNNRGRVLTTILSGGEGEFIYTAPSSGGFFLSVQASNAAYTGAYRAYIEEADEEEEKSAAVTSRSSASLTRVLDSYSAPLGGASTDLGFSRNTESAGLLVG